MEKIYRIGTRTSPLALKQVEEILNSLKKLRPAIRTEIVGIDTYGDKDKNTPISEIEGSDFFTKEIDDALINGSTTSFDILRTNTERSRMCTLTIDFAVHSAKDLPDKLREGLFIVAITDSIDPYDALVSRGGLKLDELPFGARIGTSSKRRKEALKKYRADFQIVDIRGNIEERIKLLDNYKLQITNYKFKKLDAIVIAAAGLLRLGLEHRITQRIPFEILRPHPLQGALAVVTRQDDEDTKGLFNWSRSR